MLEDNQKEGHKSNKDEGIGENSKPEINKVIQVGILFNIKEKILMI